MNIRDLEYLSEIARLGGLARAANYCHVSQSTLSIQLKKLEEELGIQIFERSQRRTIPTTIGLKIIEVANAILRQVKDINNLAKESKNPFAGILRLGAFPTLAPYWFPLIVPQIKRKFPDLKLQLVEEKTAQLLKELRDGKIDCAALALPVDDPEFAGTELFYEPFYLVVPHEHPFAKQKVVKPEYLKNESLLLLEDGHCLRGQALDFCSSQGIEESGSYRASSLETLRNMVIAGEGITIFPKLAINKSDSRLAYIAFDKGGPGRSIGLLWRKTCARASLFAAIAELKANPK